MDTECSDPVNGCPEDGVDVFDDAVSASVDGGVLSVELPPASMTAVFLSYGGL